MESACGIQINNCINFTSSTACQHSGAPHRSKWNGCTAYAEQLSRFTVTCIYGVRTHKLSPHKLSGFSWLSLPNHTGTIIPTKKAKRREELISIIKKLLFDHHFLYFFMGLTTALTKVRLFLPG